MAKVSIEMAAWDPKRACRASRCANYSAPARPIEAGVSIGIQESIAALVDRGESAPPAIDA
jgi:hypothetical protein